MVDSRAVPTDSRLPALRLLRFQTARLFVVLLILSVASFSAAAKTATFTRTGTARYLSKSGRMNNNVRRCAEVTRDAAAVHAASIPTVAAPVRPSYPLVREVPFHPGPPIPSRSLRSPPLNS